MVLSAPSVLGGVLAIDAALIERAVRPGEAMDAVLAAARSQLPAMPPRTVHPLAGGEIFLMPAAAGMDAGVKVLGLVRDNPARGLPAAQGFHLVFDAATMTPLAILDGAALTTLRTPAVPLAAVRGRLRALGRPLRAVVYGTGPQGRGFVRAIRDIAEVASLSVVSRRGVQISGAATVAAGSPDEAAALRAADLVACATSSATPVFDPALLAPRTAIVAVGAHTVQTREIAAAGFTGALVVVEDRATALREAGDVVQAIAEGTADADALADLREVARGEVDVNAPDRVIVKTTGLAWQDVAVARAVVNAVQR